MTEETTEVVAEPVEEAVNATAENENTQEQQHNPEREKAGLQEALVAERRKRQEAEYKNKFLEQQYQQVASQYQTKQPADDDEDEYTKELKNYTESRVQQGIKQSLENQFIRQNPQIVEQDPNTGETWLEKKLGPILQKKPWLALGIQQAENRYERAMEIIDDYSPKQNVASEDNRRRLEENASKPGNPAGIAKSGNISKINQIKNMSRKEFSDYRAQLRGRPPNIK